MNNSEFRIRNDVFFYNLLVILIIAGHGFLVISCTSIISNKQDKILKTLEKQEINDNSR